MDRRSASWLHFQEAASVSSKATAIGGPSAGLPVKGAPFLPQHLRWPLSNASPSRCAEASLGLSLCLAPEGLLVASVSPPQGSEPGPVLLGQARAPLCGSTPQPSLVRPRTPSVRSVPGDRLFLPRSPVGTVAPHLHAESSVPMSSEDPLPLPSVTGRRPSGTT